MQDFTRIFDGVEDPRSSNATRHDLHEMLVIALLCMICGGQSCTDMELFGRSKEEFLRRFMTLGHGIPSHDAFSALFRVLDPGCLQRALVRLAADWAGRFGPDVIAIDGKSLRQSFEDASARSPLHVVSAFAAGARLVLGQVRVADKSNEITAMPALLELLDIRGSTATADAMHTQRVTAEAVAAKGGSHVLALKGNQETLHDDVRLHMADPANAGRMLRFSDVDKGHGRIEIREASVCTRSTRCRTCITGPACRRSARSPPHGRSRGGGARRPASSCSAKGLVRSGSPARCARTGRWRIHFIGCWT